MTATEALERRIDELCAENERLRQENDRLRGARDVWQENDVKLRELVRDLYEMAYPECPSAFEAAFSDRMRELGIEVDG